ncbi:expressed unknown protein [Seminavis robusta]|uniref:G-protein coupled receptors family 2 profile 2 domain-containing protein n=1 Tax=Seminavis robusta TaxID=568900 RepID=A0A9N8DA84_9STRA|nr:expressed unknown protein [Seminavis robusta]|eukprot:Sro32_g020810.1 n/a (589) ;mRNA; r:81331-83097
MVSFSEEEEDYLLLMSLLHNDEDNSTALTSTMNSTANSTNSTTMSYLSDGQERVIALLPLIPAMLSICGSLTLIRLLHKAHYQRPYRRILLGMSCYDILNSITVSLQTFLTPRDTSRRLWAVGNTTSCNAMGFLFQFSYPSFMYFGGLSLYYVLVVKFGVTNDTFARRMEPFLHVITLAWPTITAFVGLHHNLYAEVSIGAGCWISEQAITDSCNAECIESWTWILGGLPFMLVFALVLLNNALIYCHVRNTIFAVTRPRQLEPAHDSTTTGSSSYNTTNSTTLQSQQSPRQSLRQRRHSQSLTPESQEAKVRAVGVQALLYCVVFIMTYSWTIILRLVSNDGAGPPQEPTVFPIMVLRAIFLPAMGLGTVLVYARPRYMLLRRAHPAKSRRRILQQVLWYEDDNEQGSTRRGIRTHNHNNLPHSSSSGSSTIGTNRFWMSSLRSTRLGMSTKSFVSGPSRSTSLVVREDAEEEKEDNNNESHHDVMPPAVVPDLSVVDENDAECALQSTSFHNSATTHVSNITWSAHNHRHETRDDDLPPKEDDVDLGSHCSSSVASMAHDNDDAAGSLPLLVGTANVVDQQDPNGQ